MANREIEAIIRVSSKLGNMNALRTLERQLKTINTQATAFNRTNSLMSKQMTAGWLSTARAIAPVAVAYAGVQAIKTYAEVERRVGQIGITADATAEQTSQAMGKLRNVASSLRVPFEQVVDGMDSLVSSGKSMDEAYALLPAVGKAAKASGADFRDMATTADAVTNSFGILAPQMENAFDILAYGGKAGKFELRDMASELPSLAPAFAALGYTGEAGLKKLVAMLQGVRKETGTSGEAATSLMDVLTKIRSPTIANNFKRFGVDLNRSLDTAVASGEDLMDAFLRIAVEAVNGDLSKLPQLFSDKQMLIGARALINHLGEVHDLEVKMGNAAGTIGRDFQKTFKDAKSALDEFGNAYNRIFGAGAQAFSATGGNNMINAVSTDLERLAAAMEGGWTPADSLKATLTGEDPSKVVDAFAWKAGYRTPEQQAQIDASKAYAASRVEGNRLAAGYIDGTILPHAATGKRGLPIEAGIPMPRGGRPVTTDLAPTIGDGGVPIPMARPTDADLAREEFERQWRAAAAGHAYNQMEINRAAARTGGALPDADRSLPAGVSALAGLEDRLTQAGIGVGEKATQGLEQGGTSAAEAMKTAIIDAGRQVAGAIGEALARIGNLSVNVNTSGGGRDVGISNGGVRTSGGPL